MQESETAPHGDAGDLDRIIYSMTDTRDEAWLKGYSSRAGGTPCRPPTIYSAVKRRAWVAGWRRHRDDHKRLEKLGAGS